MKPSRLCHLSWAVVCLGLMALGAYLNHGTTSSQNLIVGKGARGQTLPLQASSQEKDSSSIRSLKGASDKNTTPSNGNRFSKQSPGSIGFPSSGSPSRPSMSRSSSTVSGTTSPISETGPESETITAATLTPEEINALVLEATQESSPIARRLAFDKLLASLDASTALPMRHALAKNKADPEHWRLFDYAWSAGDPTAVTTNLPNTAEQHRNGFISNSLPGWAFADPVAAAEFVNDVDPGPVQDQFYNRLVEGLADNDIGMATDLVNDMANNGHPKTPQYTRTIANEVFETGGVPALEIWAATLPEGPLQNSARQYIKQRAPEPSE